MLCWRHLLYTIFLFRINFVYVCPSSTAAATAASSSSFSFARSFGRSFIREIHLVAHFPIVWLRMVFSFFCFSFLFLFFALFGRRQQTVYKRGVNAVFHFWEGKLQRRWPLPLFRDRTQQQRKVVEDDDDEERICEFGRRRRRRRRRCRPCSLWVIDDDDGIHEIMERTFMGISCTSLFSDDFILLETRIEWLHLVTIREFQN